MNTFTLVLADAAHTERIEGVSAFNGEDASGWFGILAGHARMMTVIEFGLARYRVGDDEDWYLATSGGLAYFHENVLTLTARRIITNRDLTAIGNEIEQTLAREEQAVGELKNQLRRLEEQMLKRFREIEFDA